MKILDYCPNCASTKLTIIYEIKGVPANSVLLLPTREEALNFPIGDIELSFCHNCGFISNLAFDPLLLEYSSRYESTQGYSPTFNEYHRTLARNLISRFDLRGKKIIEIGCGQGEFLSLLCENDLNTGIGFDPAYNEERKQFQLPNSVEIVKDYYSEKYASYLCDFLCCKMTLEHIQETAKFITRIKRSMVNSRNAHVFFQVPDVARILREFAFWDIYYEHPSYFSRNSLAYLFNKAGFEVLNVEKEYDEQYLAIFARNRVEGKPKYLNEASLTYLEESVAIFSSNYQTLLNSWKDRIHKNNGRIVIWGASSKGVSFLTTLGIREEIEFAVDINPHKQGTFIAGSGQKIVSPDFLVDYQPDVVIIMNPIYRNEIQQSLNKIGVSAELISV